LKKILGLIWVEAKKKVADLCTFRVTSLSIAYSFTNFCAHLTSQISASVSCFCPELSISLKIRNRRKCNKIIVHVITLEFINHFDFVKHTILQSFSICCFFARSASRVSGKMREQRKEKEKLRSLVNGMKVELEKFWKKTHVSNKLD
jgi:hypothetical protein